MSALHQKGTPLMKEEVIELLNLMEGNPVVFNKCTNSDNNRKKEIAWELITNLFNATFTDRPRKPEQLRLKWENLKKAARKRNMIIQRNLKSGNPFYIPPDDALDKVLSLLGAASDDVESGNDKTQDTEEDTSMHAQEPKFFFTSVSKAKLKRQAQYDDVKETIIERNKAIADYYKVKRRYLELKIKNLEQSQLNNS